MYYLCVVEWVFLTLHVVYGGELTTPLTKTEQCFANFRGNLTFECNRGEIINVIETAK